MKRKLSVALLLIAALSLLFGCGKASTAPGGTSMQNSSLGEHKLSVVSTIFPGYDFTREIADGSVSLAMLLPPGSESHSFAPTPQDIIAIQNCDVFIYVGGDSDTWVDELLDSMDTSGMIILSMMDLVEVVEEEIKEGMEHDHDDDDEDHNHNEDEEDDHHHDTEYDEHVWTSPVNAMVITQAIADALCALDQANANIYRENTAAYLGELEELDASFRQVVASAGSHTLIFGDRFPFRYFVDEYGLDYYAAFPGCSTETESSAKTVAFLIDKVRDENISAVFYIEFSNKKMADTISESTGADKLLLHSCHNVTKADFEQGVTYLELMEQNVENLRKGLN